MPNYDKIEKDYEDSNVAIEAIVNEEMQKIKKKTAQIRKEAEKIGEDVELAMKESKTGTAKKKS